MKRLKTREDVTTEEVLYLVNTGKMLVQGSPLGWRQVSFGVFKLKQVQEKGEGLKPGVNTDQFKGFFISFAFWFPLDW